MANDRPRRIHRQPAKIGPNEPQNFSLMSARGHEFQEDTPHDVPLSALATVPRNIFARAFRNYRDDPNTIVQSAIAAGNLTPFEQANIAVGQRKSNFINVPFVFSTTPVLLLPASNRTYFFIQNLDGALNLLLGFAWVPSTTVGLRVNPGFAYEPFEVPQNDIWVIGTGTGNGMLVYSNG